MGILRKDAPKPGRDKMNLDQSIKRGGKVVDEDDLEKRYGKNASSKTIMFVFAFSVVFAFIYSEFYVDSSSLMRVFSDSSTNKIFFGPGYANLMGDRSIDQILNILIRAVFFMGVFGLSPYLTYLASKMHDSTAGSYYYRNWGVLAFCAFAFALVHALLGPLFMDLVGIFTEGL